ncbi:uncharacterized protein LOC141541906 isoform X2 [Sminthopsis crassicaudata]
MATSPKETETTSDQEHQKAKEYKNFVNSFKELLSKTTILLKRNINTSDQECQKAKEKKLEHSSRRKEDYKILEKLKSLVTLLKEYQKSNDKEHQKTTEDFSTVPKGDKLSEDFLEHVQDDSLAAFSSQVQLPLTCELRKSLSRSYPILPPVPPAPVVNEKGRFDQQTRRPRFTVSHQRTSPHSCIYCRRVPRPRPCFYSTAMNTLKNLKTRLQDHAIQQQAQRSFQNHLDFCDQSNEDILPGYQTRINSSLLTNSLRQIATAMPKGERAATAMPKGERAATAMPKGERAATAMPNGQYYNSSEEDDDDGFTLMCDSKSLKGPLRCPYCLEIYSHSGDFLKHMKKHSCIKVCFLVKKPNFYLCPYCKQTFFSSESILAHKCLKQ